MGLGLEILPALSLLLGNVVRVSAKVRHLHALAGTNVGRGVCVVNKEFCFSLLSISRVTQYSCHHTQYTCCRIHCRWAITYSLLIRARLQYVWYQTTIYMTSYEFYVISQPLLLTSKTVFMTSHPQYSWIQTHCIRHDLHYTCDITATVTMTRHVQCFWHDTQCIWDLTRWMNGNTMTVSVMIPNVSV